MYSFRTALPDDLDAIMNVVREAQVFMASMGIDQWQDGYPSRELIAQDIRLGRAYVMEADGAVSSITILTDEPELVYDAIDGAWHAEGAYLTLHRMALSDRCRHSGLAAEIMRRAIEMARAAGLRSLRADTHRGNKAMRRFLEKQGFLLCGTVQYPVDAGDPVRVAYDLIL